MTFDEAQTTFQQIIRRINTNSTPADLLLAQRALDALEDELRGKDGFDSIRAGIDSVYDKLVGQITGATLKDIQSRDEIFKNSNNALTAISQQANQSAKTLALEKTKVVLPALNKSVEEVKGVVDAIKGGDMNKALGKSESLWALVEQVKAKLTDA